jgi:hypothetical protein
MPGDGKDISDALARACAAIGSRGGGALLLDPGTYVLDRPVTIRADGVVIRGSGAAATRVLFRYALPESGIAFYTPDPGRRVGPKTGVELHCLPKDLAKMRILVDDKPVGEWKRGPHSGNSFSFAKTGAAVVAAVPNGPHQLKGVGEYSDGTTRRCDIPVIVDSGFGETPAVAESRAALLFAGPGPVGPKLRLTEDGKRGALQVVLEGTTGLAPGDRILIEAPATDRWKTLTRNACQWGSYRRYEVEVEKIEGTALTLGQPLRLEFPVIDGAYVQKIVPIQRCGVEALTTEQTEDLWISSVLFSNAWNCWARGVIVRKCGRFPIYGAMAKWCEIRDCVFADAWFKGGGGTAYGGWENCWDCLLEGIETFRLRHAPLFQWAASGCVIRKGVFHHSDGQWHSGWTNENLFEQCTIESTTGNGGYGFGLWASPPEDTAHGPNGPRNVVYHCEVTSPRSGLWMGGMNENWLILYNRFTVETGPGVFAKDVSFDHILRGNVFRLRDGKSALLRLATPDCTGVELIDNVLVGGNGQFCEGGGYPALLQANRLEPTGADPHPTPPVPSIYEWQKQQAK